MFQVLCSKTTVSDFKTQKENSARKRKIYTTYFAVLRVKAKCFLLEKYPLGHQYYF